MSTFNPENLHFLTTRPTKKQSEVFHRLLDTVTDGELTTLQGVVQYGGKRGQTLLTHVLSGIFLLEQLATLFGLTEREREILFITFILHDMNKMPEVDGRTSLLKLTTQEEIASAIEHYGLDHFFPDYRTYLPDIQRLIREHSGHYTLGMEALFGANDDATTLGGDSISNRLVPLIQAVDAADLLHSLHDKPEKQRTILHKLNTVADGVQYEFVWHEIGEQRGIFTNIFHNALADTLQKNFGAVPLFFFPEGITYLVPRGTVVAADEALFTTIGRAAGGSIAAMVGQNYRDFIERKPAGMKVDPKCLELGIPFEGENGILNEIYRIVQRANFDVTDVARKAAERTTKRVQTLKEIPETVYATIQKELQNPFALVAQSPSRLRDAELIRSYYLFINDHFGDVIPHIWEHLYRLLDVPAESHAYFACFDERYDRAYAVIKAVPLEEAEIYSRIEADGRALLAATPNNDPTIENCTLYAQRYISFSFAPPSPDAFQAALTHYIHHQHGQCVNCAGVFPIVEWMSANVRSDIKVQAFSNRLRGGGSAEPKKNICVICNLQFLLESLNYPTVRDEKTVYLHLFPYSFFTAPLIEGLRRNIQEIVSEEPNVLALHLNRLDETMQAYGGQRPLRVTFTSRTKKQGSHPYGVYVPRFSQTVGNVLVFPINAPGDNDTERFLFAFQYALILQKTLGMKVLLSQTPAAPLSKTDIGDVYVDMIPLGLQGLLDRNDFSYWAEQNNNGKPQHGNLDTLQKVLGHIFAIREVVRNPTSAENELVTLVRALQGSPLAMFYEVEHLLERRVDAGKYTASQKAWLAIRHTQLMRDDVTALVHLLLQRTGESRMTHLSSRLDALATTAWEHRIIGRSLRKNSLVAGLDIILTHLSHWSEAFDEEAVKAQTAQELQDHLIRTKDAQYRPGLYKGLQLLDRCRQFVDAFYTDILHATYQGKVNRLLADEKGLRAAYLFYIRQHLPRQAPAQGEVEPTDAELYAEDSTAD